MDKVKIRKLICCMFAVIITVTAPLCSMQTAFADESTDSEDTTQAEENSTTSVEESSVAELDKLAYSGDDLGATYTKEATTFKVWSPTATKVQVLLYATGSDEEENSKYLSVTDMEYDEKTGVWTASIEGDLLNKYYTYYVYNGKKGKETVDIYAKAVGVNGNRGMIVDLDSTDPEGWAEDKHVTVQNPTEAIVWEVNVKDFSNDPASGVSKENRGKYLAFTEEDTTLNSSGYTPTGINYLKELGVNYVQLLPVFDFGSIDESSNEDQFNWGYDPKNYNVPEGSYSSDPYDGNVRINEFKQMVQSIHNNGMGVIMDVVFNHTYEGAKSWFNITVPGYYYRYTESGTWSNGSGCGNDTASEHAMFRKYMVDSIVYWATEYHIDGFRFDLMGLHDVETMNAIRAALDQIEGGDKIIIYGEGWSLDTNAEPGTVLATQQNMSQMDERIGAFNDGIRDGIKGSNFNPAEGGYVQGGQGTAKVKSGIKAEVGNWAKTPTQTVTYNSCHDNYTLWDKLVATSGTFDDYTSRNEEIVSMNKLATAITLTSQGIGFFQAGEEFARTKKGDENSYKSSSKINQLDWERSAEYGDLVQYYAGLIEIRKNFAPFTDPTDTSAKAISFLENMPKGVIAYTLKNKVTASTQWDQVALIFNASANDEEITLSGNNNLPDEWVVVVNGDSAGLGGLAVVNEGKVTVKAGTAVMLVDKASFDSIGLKSDKGTVTVKHVDADSGDTIKKQVLSGTIGKSYSIKPDSSISLEYTYKNASGSVTGKYKAEGAEVTLYYIKYTGTYGTTTIKFVDSETGEELTESVTQKGRTGERYYTAELPTVKGYALDLTNLPNNGSGKFTDGNTEILYKYSPVQNEAVTVHYYNSNGWDNLTLYAYGNGERSGSDTKEILGEWPGVKMQDDGDGWWSYTIPSAELEGVGGVRVIFADGNAQDPLAGNEGYLVSGEVWINNGVIADKNDKEIVCSGTVNVIYVDYSGAIIDKDVLTGDVDKSYNVIPKDFFGYELVSNSDNAAGYYTAEEINVIFNYKPNYGKSLVVWLAAGGVAVLAGGIAAFILRKKKTV